MPRMGDFWRRYPEITVDDHRCAGPRAGLDGGVGLQSLRSEEQLLFSRESSQWSKTRSTTVSSSWAAMRRDEAVMVLDRQPETPVHLRVARPEEGMPDAGWSISSRPRLGCR